MRALYFQGIHMKQILILITILFSSSLVYANTTICQTGDSLMGVKEIQWNSETFNAKVTDALNNTRDGKVTLIREHKPYGVKVNVFVNYPERYYSADAAEYIIFPIADGSFRIIGVTYFNENNKQHLNTSEGVNSATCLTTKI
jgi:hypothetical protein